MSGAHLVTFTATASGPKTYRFSTANARFRPDF